MTARAKGSGLKQSGPSTTGNLPHGAVTLRELITQHPVFK